MYRPYVRDQSGTIAQLMQQMSQSKRTRDLEMLDASPRKLDFFSKVTQGAYDSYLAAKEQEKIDAEKAAALEIEAGERKILAEGREMDIRKGIYDIDKDRIERFENLPSRTIANLINEEFIPPAPGQPGESLFLPGMPPNLDDVETVGGIPQLTVSESAPRGTPQPQVARIRSPFPGQPDIPVPIRTREMELFDNHWLLQEKIAEEGRAEKASERGEKHKADIAAEVAKTGQGYALTNIEAQAAAAFRRTGLTVGAANARASASKYEPIVLPHPRDPSKGNVQAFWTKDPNGDVIFVYPPTNGQPTLASVDNPGGELELRDSVIDSYSSRAPRGRENPTFYEALESNMPGLAGVWTLAGATYQKLFDSNPEAEKLRTELGLVTEGFSTIMTKMGEYRSSAQAVTNILDRIGDLQGGILKGDETLRQRADAWLDVADRAVKAHTLPGAIDYGNASAMAGLYSLISSALALEEVLGMPNRKLIGRRFLTEEQIEQFQAGGHLGSDGESKQDGAVR